ncbi:uncharacterized protein DUF4124 [Sulfuritortus calidifontis]|uniref:Uncharacterized protein DUF4124 n=1 Tax=Sulfuritortus calidifontis TaxID=1914471 RepID=A0A4R3JW92_9PROT|nr:DUF4124 domain-containing protein [Sulfuritortus calidifontis]TCS71321.1 uncharacterized protein DUF4124 [Sulfuritortus calidifontis]
MRIVLGLLCLACTTTVHAEIYKYVDESGHVTYSNTPQPGSKPLDMDGRPAKAKTKAPSPYYFPRVDKATQQQRDSMRRQLLLDELQQEQRNLAVARAAQRQPGADAGKAAETVRLHEKNIEMLNKELARIK